MKYYFKTGRHFSLSKAELLSLLPLFSSSYSLDEISNEAIIVDTKDSIDNLFSRLGGFISYGEIIDDIDFALEFKNKVIFGVNIFTDSREWGGRKYKGFVKEIKGRLKEYGISSAFIEPTNGLVLNAVQVDKNDILEKGFLLDVFDVDGKVITGRCKEIQNIEEFSEIEFDKPFTDKKVGVLPAKLARIMVNLTAVKEGDTIWDPFCGSGTTILEALSLGIDAIGSDLNPKAVEMTEKNIMWLGKRIDLSERKFNIFPYDVVRPDKKVTSLIKNTEVTGIVCEPYMGAPALSRLSTKEAKDRLNLVIKLYSNLFDILERTRMDKVRIAIILPSYLTKKGWITASVNDFTGKKWKILNEKLGGDLHWSRSDSIIRRNIFILTKKNN